ncbi:MAG: GAF domain-containing protein [Rhodothermus sp.]|nr:GAF domain-containing protein [Rhodothermus sp.]
MSPLSVNAGVKERVRHYEAVLRQIDALLEGETDWIAAMATVACALHHAFDYYHWTGFYRAVSDDLLIVGPYQGTHGCLRIPFSRGVCGAAARTRQTQLVPDVHQFPDHIACSSTTQSEIVVPVLTPDGRLLAVLDVDSDEPAAFNATDQHYLEQLCAELGRRFADTSLR